MDTFDSGNDFEKYLRQKSADARMPFSGGLELLPDCNLDCKFCYVHQNRLHRVEQGQILSAEEWMSIIQQAYDMGIYSLLVTGGEPLLYPEFKKLFAWLSEKGLILTLNSNGTLFNEEWIAFFKDHGVRQFNISLYGTDNETYESLCGIKDGFTKVMHTFQLLKEAGFHFRISVSVVPQNMHQLEHMKEIADELDVAIAFATYMFAGSRREVDPAAQYRMSPEEAARASAKCFHLQHPNVNYEASCRYSLSKLANPQHLNDDRKGFSCYVGKSDFWLSWNGEMRACGMFRMPELTFDLKKYSFADCWAKLVEESQRLNSVCQECKNCNMRDLCERCPAANYAESHKLDGRPDYLCRKTTALVDFLRSEVNRMNRAHEEKSPAEALPKVSVIIPVYNVEKYLGRCIESILTQRLQDFELILVDDGSTDGSPKICDDFGALDPRIRVIHQENKGVSAARNAGIDAARAAYVLFMDSDDYAENTWASSLYEKILARPDALIMTNTWVGNEENQRKLTIHEEFPDYDHISLEESRRIIVFAYVWNKIYCKDLLSRVRFDESISYNEDNLFNLEYAKHCKEVVFIPDPQVIHLSHAGGLAEQGLARQGKTLADVFPDGLHEEIKLVRRR